jgi:hypothetical protein
VAHHLRQIQLESAGDFCLLLLVDVFPHGFLRRGDQELNPFEVIDELMTGNFHARRGAPGVANSRYPNSSFSRKWGVRPSATRVLRARRTL